MYAIGAEECDQAAARNPFQRDDDANDGPPPPPVVFEPPPPPKPLSMYEDDAEYDGKVEELRAAIKEHELNKQQLKDVLTSVLTKAGLAEDYELGLPLDNADSESAEQIKQIQAMEKECLDDLEECRKQLETLSFCYICNGNKSRETDCDRYVFVDTIEAYAKQVYKYGPVRIYEQIGIYYKKNIERMIGLPWTASAVRRHFTRHVHHPLFDRFQMLDTLRDVERQLGKRALTASGDVLLTSARTLLDVIKQREVLLRAVEDGDAGKEQSQGKRRKRG